MKYIKPRPITPIITIVARIKLSEKPLLSFESFVFTAKINLSVRYSAFRWEIEQALDTTGFQWLSRHTN
jgi:hypothetical protein